MASRYDHNLDGRKAAEAMLGREPSAEELEIIDKINERLDQFAHYPEYRFLEQHRKFLHHREGVEYFEMLYGKLGKLIAEVHIRRDCGEIPNAVDYYTGQVNEFGIGKLKGRIKR